MSESKVETIGVKEQRKLREVTHELGEFLSYGEFYEIMNSYTKVINRLLIESGETLQ